MNQPVCPTCSAVLNKFPARKTKCPQCGNFIYVKRAPGESEKRLVTETQAAEIEKQWESRTARDRYMHILSAYGVDESEYEHAIKIATANETTESIYWQAAYDLFEKHLNNERDLNARKMIYYNLASLCDEKGMEFRSFLRKAAETELEHYGESRGMVIGVEIRNSGLPHTCSVCQANSEKRIDLESALRNSPLPCDGCVCPGSGGALGFCRCHFYPVFTSDGGAK